MTDGPKRTMFQDGYAREAGVASVSSRLCGIVAVVAALLALAPATASAQERGPIAILTDPVIVGEPQVGSTLTATGARWRSPDPDSSRHETALEWYSCPAPRLRERECPMLRRSDSYTLTQAERGRYIYLLRWIRWLNDVDDPNPEYWDYTWRFRSSAVLGPVTVPPPPPPPPPPPVPVPTVAPAPAPTFDTAAPAPTPVPTSGQVLHNSASKRKAIRPFPIVRMRGRLTARGARVTVLSVRAPRPAKITVRCKGKCPTSRWTRSSRKSRLTRVRALERSLRSGTRIIVTVTRHGYIGKRTTFVIRRGQPPRRVDNCLNHRNRVTRCP
jgi:hypothetical protein